jgi:hypothetical protein
MSHLNVGMIVEMGNVIPRDDSLDAITIRIGLGDEPEYDVDNVHDPDSLQTQRR